jgi:ATP-dependent Zn protease
LSTGAAADLEQARSVARQMVSRHGMGDDLGLSGGDESAPAAIAAVGQILQREMSTVAQQLAAHRVPLDRLVASLLEHNRLYRQEIESILGRPPVTAG